MHKITANYNALISHTAGGGYTTINSVNDGEGGQMTGGESPGGQSGMSGEMGGGDQAPQNYGFTSVVADGENIGSGKGTGAEALMSYAGGNRSFAVAGVMQDRRERLKGLDKVAKGSVALHGLKKWGQQLLNTEKGWFMSGNMDRKMRFALTENKKNQEQQQQGGGQSGGGGGAATREGESGGGSGGGESGGQKGEKKLGQESLHEENEESKIFYDTDKNRTHQGHEDGQAWYDKDVSLGYHKDKNKSYRADKDHSHIAHTNENVLFTDAGGCFSTKEIVIKADNCGGSSSTRAVATGWHLAHVVAPLVQNTHTASLAYHEPLWLVNNSLTLKHANPLTVDGTGTLQVKHVIPLALDGSGNLKLKFASPLIVDAGGNLTVTPDPALGGLAPISSPVFTGDPRAPTPAPTDNDTSIATTAWVKSCDSPHFTGVPTAPIFTPGSGVHDNDNTIATTSFVSNHARMALEPLLARIDELQARLTTVESRLA